MINDHKRSYQHAIDGSTTLPDRERYGISEDAFVFCYFGQLYKIDPQLFDVLLIFSPALFIHSFIYLFI